MTTSVLLVEDHPLMGQMLSRLLREWGNMEVWALAPSAEAALAALAGEEGREPGATAGMPDLVMVDVSLPGTSGIELTATLARLYPDLPCLIVSAHRDGDYVRRALDSGARGYVAKAEPRAIVEAVERVLAGEVYLSEVARQALAA